MRRGQLQLLLAVRVAFYPGERKSLSFLSMWEDYGFVFLGIMRGLCSFGDLDLFITLWGDYDFLILAIMIFCSWG